MKYRNVLVLITISHSVKVSPPQWTWFEETKWTQSSDTVMLNFGFCSFMKLVSGKSLNERQFNIQADRCLALTSLRECNIWWSWSLTSSVDAGRVASVRECPLWCIFQKKETKKKKTKTFECVRSKVSIDLTLKVSVAAAAVTSTADQRRGKWNEGLCGYMYCSTAYYVL